MTKFFQKTIFNEFIFKIAFLIFSFIYIFPFTMDQSQRFAKVFLLWGLIIILYDLFTKRVIFQNKFNYFLYMFLIFSFLSVIFNHNIYKNFTIFLYLIIQTVVPLMVDKHSDKNDIYKQISIINMEIIVISFFVAACSFYFYLIDIKASITVNRMEYLFGMNEGRLYGIMGNPNSGSLIAMLSICVSLLIITMNKHNLFRMKKLTRNFIYINISLQFIIFCLGNSRSAMISLCCAITVIAIYFYKKKYLPKSKFKRFKVLTYFVICVVITLGIYVFSLISNKLVSYLPAAANSVIDIVEKEIVQKKIERKHIKKRVDSERDYYSEDNSNGRFTIWLTGLEVFKNNPLVGVGNENISEEARKVIRSFENKEILANMHNIYLQILVGCGVFAFVSFALFSLSYLLNSLRCIFKYTDNINNDINIYIFAIIITLFIENLFDSNILYFMCLFIVPIFWNYLGYSKYFKSQVVDEIQ